VVIGAWSMNYLVVLLHILNMGIQVEICAREIVLMVNNSRKTMIFHDILYYLNVTILQCVFETH
jgi:hypothetical protein